MAIVVPQAALGAGTALLAFLTGQLLFGLRAGLIAAAITALYPYYVVHDTALQETCLQTFFTILSVYLLLLARRRRATALCLAAGLALGVTVLVRTSMLPFALSAVAWLGFAGTGSWRRRAVHSLMALLVLGAVTGAWMARNAYVTGGFVLTSEAGLQFWMAHNAQTFSRYPQGSIDRSTDEAYRALQSADVAALTSLKNDEIARSDWYRRRGFDYLRRQHPAGMLRDAAHKVAAGFSWRFNPARPGLPQLVYFLSYVPIVLLGLLGALLNRRGWREHSLVYLNFLTFAAVSAVFWAHTNHRVYLDVYLIIFAAAAIDGMTNVNVLRTRDARSAPEN